MGGLNKDKKSTRRGVILSLTHSIALLLVAPSTWAACLPGDTSVDCIGVYKVPLDDEIAPFLQTPQDLIRYQVDVERWVPPIPVPTSASQAMKGLQAASAICASDIPEAILKGNLEAAGVSLLTILPQITVAGRYLVKQRPSSSTRLESAFQELEVSLADCEVLMGQALRGDAGSSITFSQIQLLSTMNTVNEVQWKEIFRLLGDTK